jgi:hypothetical protein
MQAARRGYLEAEIHTGANRPATSKPANGCQSLVKAQSLIGAIARKNCPRGEQEDLQIQQKRPCS